MSAARTFLRSDLATVLPSVPPAAAESASSLVELGLNLIARASEGSSEGYFVAGHRGAGLIAAELFARDNSLD